MINEALLLPIIFLGLLFFLYAIGVPIAFALGLVAAAVMIIPIGPSWTTGTFALRVFGTSNSFILLAVPFFILVGRLMNNIGITEDLFDLANLLVGFLPGGLGHVNVVVSTIFSGMSGSALADAAGLGQIEYKAMTDNGYNERFAIGITGASATIGPIIPPSIPLIVYGALAEVSIGTLFIAGIVPGILMALSMMGMITFLAYRASKRQSEDVYADPDWTFDGKKVTHALIKAIPGLLTPVIIVGGIVMGIYTATEAAAVALLYTVLIGVFYYKNLTWSGMFEATKETFADTAVLMLILAFANLFGYLLIISNITPVLIDILFGVTTNPTFIILLLMGLYLFLGTFMSALAAIVVTIPVVAPILPQAGIDPVVFGIVMMVTLMLGLITPPYGTVLFALDRVTDLELGDIMKGMIPFYIPLAFVVLVIIFNQELILYLPRLAGLY